MAAKIMLKSIISIIALMLVFSNTAYALEQCNSTHRAEIYPPWQKGKNNPSLKKGLIFTVPEVNDLSDFHGTPQNPLLVIFVGGNYYFAMPDLIRVFENKHPKLRGRIYYETLPPGILKSK